MANNNTIFDDVFRTMLEKMPKLIIPLINEIFSTDYPMDIPIIQLRNEHQTKNGERITDSYFIIGEKRYHIECQSTKDSGMIIRMIEYDFSISLENIQQENGIYRMYFPHISEKTYVSSSILHYAIRKETPGFFSKPGSSGTAFVRICFYYEFSESGIHGSRTRMHVS